MPIGRRRGARADRPRRLRDAGVGRRDDGDILFGLHPRARFELPGAAPALGLIAGLKKPDGHAQYSGLSAGAAGRGIYDQPDPVPARRLALDQIDYMTEQPAKRGAQHMQDIEGRG